MRSGTSSTATNSPPSAAGAPARPRQWRLATLLLLVSVSGCNYVHFGRLDKPGDSAIATENSDLLLQRRLLQQELAIVRGENDSLHDALERVPGVNVDLTRSHVAHEAARTERELPSPEREKKLAAVQRDFAALQEENRQLHVAITQAHAENAALTAQAEKLIAQNATDRSALAELKSELQQQKEARATAEAAATGLRRQLAVVHTRRETSRSTDTTAANRPAATLPQSYVVQPGDTLVTIARHFYGRNRWSLIYLANNAQLRGDRPLQAGMVLSIPAE